MAWMVHEGQQARPGAFRCAVAVAIATAMRRKRGSLVMAAKPDLTREWPVRGIHRIQIGQFAKTGGKPCGKALSLLMHIMMLRSVGTVPGDLPCNMLSYLHHRLGLGIAAYVHAYSSNKPVIP